MNMDGLTSAPEDALADTKRKPVGAARMKQRRQMLLLQAVSYGLGNAILLIYACAGTVSATIPVMYFVFGMGLTALFALLSEMQFGEKFEDHFLTTPQAAANILMQLGFMIAAPQIGFLFLTVVFVIFGYAALRMTSRQAVILWAATGAGVTAIFFFLPATIGIPTATRAECFAAACSFLLTIGQCAYLGHFGNSMRARLHQRTIELRTANQKIEELAQVDELTGLPNRRAIMKMLNDEIVRAQRTNLPCCVAIIDLDYFKRINDQFGHGAGDEALRTFATNLFANLRAMDRLGRYGGEEFLLIMPDTSQGQALQVVDRLRSMVSGLDWSALFGRNNVTMSAGICTVRRYDSASEVIARADVALYRAKDAGRNRVLAA
jgi:diguanylate cyclase (GGDEF)-like protein